MKKQLGFYVDAKHCLGCYTCAMACKNQHQLQPGVSWRRLDALNDDIFPHHERAFYSLACHHCEHPACLANCPADAYAKRDEDGIVIHNHDRCIGCGNCLCSCPFGAPRFNERLQRAEKCSLCWERLDAGLDPACVQSCPTDALKLIDLATFDAPDAVQNPPGFPNRPQLNPSTRFRLPQLPTITKRDDFPAATNGAASEGAPREERPQAEPPRANDVAAARGGEDKRKKSQQPS